MRFPASARAARPWLAALLAVTGSVRAIAAGDEAPLAGDEVVGKVLAQIAAGEHQVRIPAGTYVFAKAGPVLLLTRPEKLDIDASDVTFRLRRDQAALRLWFGNDVKLHGLRVEYDPPPYFQGTIAGIDQANRRLLVSVDPGFTDESIRAGFKPGSIKAVFFTQDGSRLKDTPLDWVMAVEPVEDRPGRFYVRLKENFIFTGGGGGSPAVGEHLVCPNRVNPNTFTISDSAAVTLQDISVSTAPQWAFVEERGAGGNQYIHCTVGRAPDGKGLLACTADVFHSLCVQKGPLLQNCSFSFAGDDFVNIHGFYSIVLDSTPDGQAHVLSLLGTQLHAGTAVRIVDAANFAEVGTATVAHVQAAKLDKLTDLTLPFWPKDEKMREPPGPLFLCDVQFAGPVTLPAHALLEDPSAMGNGAVLVDNKFSDGLCRGLVIRSSDTQISGNTIQRTGLAALLVGSEYYWFEAGFPKNVSIFGNTINQPSFVANQRPYLTELTGGIVISNVTDARNWTSWLGGQFGADAKAGKGSAGIVIEQNRINGGSGPPILLDHIDGVTLKGNEIQAVPVNARSGIVVRQSNPVVQTGNRVSTD